jgi:hypothetical protein
MGDRYSGRSPWFATWLRQTGPSFAGRSAGRGLGTAISPPTEQFASHEDARVITQAMVRDSANSF